MSSPTMWLDVVGTKCTVDKRLRAVGTPAPTIKIGVKMREGQPLPYNYLPHLIVNSTTKKLPTIVESFWFWIE